MKIEQHKQKKSKIGSRRKQSKDLYRSDNLIKKVWRSLKHIVSWKTKELVDSLPAKVRKDPFSIHAKIKHFLQSFQMAHDLRTYYTLLSCMLFLAKKRTYMDFIKKLNFEPKVYDWMVKEARKFKNLNDNKTKEIEWREIFNHPIFSLGKRLFYTEEHMQTSFFIKSLGCDQKDCNESTKTRMTLINDYEYFRKRVLNTLEKKFSSLY